MLAQSIISDPPLVLVQYMSQKSSVHARPPLQTRPHILAFKQPESHITLIHFHRDTWYRSKYWHFRPVLRLSNVSLIVSYQTTKILSITYAGDASSVNRPSFIHCFFLSDGLSVGSGTTCFSPFIQSLRTRFRLWGGGGLIDSSKETASIPLAVNKHSTYLVLILNH